MSTNSRIGYLENGQVKNIYCHWDGYTSHNGAILLDHYDTLDKVKALVDRSNVSSLGSKPLNTRFYDGAQESPTLEDIASFKKDAYYHYLFDVKNNEWTLFHKGETYKLSDVINSHDIFSRVENFIDNKSEFASMQDFREALNNGYQSWIPAGENFGMIYSCYIPEDNVIEVTKTLSGFREDVFANIPCNNLQEALAISDNLIGKTYEQVCEEYDIPLGYLSVECTDKSNPLFEILSNELNKKVESLYGSSLSILSINSFKIDINTNTNEVSVDGLYTRDFWGTPKDVDTNITSISPEVKEKILEEYYPKEPSLADQIQTANSEKVEHSGNEAKNKDLEI